MALKGIGVNNDLYVVQTYYDPESYTTPTPSEGAYVVADFVASDYVQSPFLITSAFTLSCDAVVINTRATLTSTFTISVQGTKFDFASASLTATSSLSCNGGRLQQPTASSSAITTASTDASQTHRTTKTISATATLSGNANVSFKSTASPSAVVSTISVGGIIYNAFQEGRQDDYTWDDFSEDSTIDRTWNEWFGGKWHPGMIVFSKGFTFSCNGGLISSGTGTFTITTATSQNGNRTAGGQGSYSSLFGIASDYIRIRNVSTSVSSAFSVPTKIGSVVFGGGVLSFNTAYSIDTLKGNTTYGPTKTITSAFTPQVNANAIFDPTKLLAPIATLQANGNVQFSIPTLTVNAFNTVLSFGRLITIADPWNILTVPVESRTFVVPIETRQNAVSPETRVNTITTETRRILVDEETRKITIFKPTFSNRSSIPKVRSEA